MTGQWDREAGGVRLAQSFDALSLDPQPDVSRQLLDLCELLASWATRISLTGHRQPGAILDRLVLDALALSAALPAAPSIADLGSGAGFPGLPLALLAPDCQVTLVESNGKKARFLREALRVLAIDNARVAESRAEALDEPSRYDFLVSRAFSSLADFVRVGARLLNADGRMLAMKGVLPAEEIAALPKGWRLAATHALHVPGLGAQRHLLELMRETDEPRIRS